MNELNTLWQCKINKLTQTSDANCSQDSFIKVMKYTTRSNHISFDVLEKNVH